MHIVHIAHIVHIDRVMSDHIRYTMAAIAIRSFIPYSQYLLCFVVFLLVVLSLDAMDVSGESQIDVISNVFKERLTLDGTPIDAEHEKHGKLAATLGT